MADDSVRRILPTRHALAAVVLLWIALLHFTGLALFTRGFLLVRLALPNKTTCGASSPPCTLPPTHKRAVLLVIDALRFDFVAPHPSHTPSPSSEFYHNVLTLPAYLTQEHPDHSLLFNAHADPPTATLQRIKGITTGSLPTFVDIGSSFSGVEINEDSIVFQLRAAGRNVAFAGDDTWKAVYPTSFSPNMSFPFDSFNVEDLHTVDEGVIRHLFPLLEDKDAGWDLLIGHFLGVDHVGHRLGPDHPTMRAKLKQMNQVLTDVVSALDDDTLLVVLGDHGMDSKGDHGGDGVLETSSAMWVYSKSSPLSLSSSFHERLSVHPNVITTRPFPSAQQLYRSIQQIDLVPTLSLLLGLPIPFNNLGSVIPELFTYDNSGTGPSLNTALEINSRQIMTYLETYRSSPSGAELDNSWNDLSSLFDATLNLQGDDRIVSHFMFMRNALSECRTIWAQFNSPLMFSGLVVLVGCLPVLAVLYLALASKRSSWEDVGHAILILGWGGVVGGVVLGLLGTSLAKAAGWTVPLPITTIIAASAAITSEIAVLVPNALPTIKQLFRSFASGRASKANSLLPLLVLVLHSISFTSNSFILWEDRLILFLIISLLFPAIVSSLSFPSSALRKRVFAYGIAIAFFARLVSISTVCREEQHPYCHVTFYSSSTLPLSPVPVLVLSLPIAYFLPTIVRQLFLTPSKSDKGTAPLFIEILWRAALLAGTAYWAIEWTESVFGQDGASSWTADSLLLRTIVGRAALSGTFGAAYAFWWYAPLNIEVRTEDPVFEESKSISDEDTNKPRVLVLGYANAYGSPYLIFVLAFFALLWIVTQLSGQVALAFVLLAILSYVELVDTQRDARALSASFEGATSAEAGFDAVASQDDLTSGPSDAISQVRSPTFSEPVMLALLSHLAFFGTGHQAVLSSIQWKTAFVGFPTLTYPFSPILVSLNTFGPFILAALSLPLLATWAVSPIQRGKVLVLSDTMRLATGMMIYFTSLLVLSAGASAVLRRHLMMWKVFAPRFMLAGVTLLLVDVALCVAVLVGVRRGVIKVERVFGTSV